MKKSVILTLLTLCSFLWSENLQAQNAITLWKDGIPTIFFAPDSVFFWREDAYNNDGKDNGEEVELTEAEQIIEQASSDEGDDVPVAVYSEEDSLRYDAMAQEVIAMFETDDEPNIRKVRSSIDEQAEEVIRNNGKNIFEKPTDGGLQLVIEQEDRDSGQWGKTRYGGFKVFWTTSSEYGKRCLLVVFYHKGGFPNKKTAYLKLGQPNNGKNEYNKDHYKTIIYPGSKYGFIRVYIDDYLPDYGLVNFFPLLVTEGNEARNYLNPICVKSEPIVPDGWADLPYGAEFGRINGVPVYCNTRIDSSTGQVAINDKGKECKNISGVEYQCVQLCKRYIKTMYGLDATGNAKEWPDKRRQDPDHYIVFVNDGREKVREGDLIVWNYGPLGHIGVVIKTAEKHISVAHQNGGGRLRPIGSTLQIENGIIKDTMLGSSIIAFIRAKNKYEVEDKEKSYPLLRASTTNMDFGEVEASISQTKKFRIENTGTSVLTISSIELSKGKNFSIDGSGCTLEPNETRTFTVTFTPDKAGEFKDRIIIRSDAEDNPLWVIHLTGKGTGGTPTDGLIVMERKYMVDSRGDYSTSWVGKTSDNYAYQSFHLGFDNDNSLSIQYLNAYYWNNQHIWKEGIYVYFNHGDNTIKEWYIEPRRNGTWVDEKIVIDAAGNVRYYSDGNLMGEELFAELNLDKATNVVVNMNPYGWWYTHYHYMDDFKLTTPATVVSDDFEDGVLDTGIWQQPVNPNGVREEDGIMKTEQLRTDWNFQLKSNPIPLY